MLHAIAKEEHKNQPVAQRSTLQHNMDSNHWPSTVGLGIPVTSDTAEASVSHLAAKAARRPDEGSQGSPVALMAGLWKVLSPVICLN